MNVTVDRQTDLRQHVPNFTQMLRSHVQVKIRHKYNKKSKRKSFSPVSSSLLLQ